MRVCYIVYFGTNLNEPHNWMIYHFRRILEWKTRTTQESHQERNV